MKLRRFLSSGTAVSGCFLPLSVTIDSGGSGHQTLRGKPKAPKQTPRPCLLSVPVATPISRVSLTITPEKAEPPRDNWTRTSPLFSPSLLLCPHFFFSHFIICGVFPVSVLQKLNTPRIIQILGMNLIDNWQQSLSKLNIICNRHRDFFQAANLPGRLRRPQQSPHSIRHADMAQYDATADIHFVSPLLTSKWLSLLCRTWILPPPDIGIPACPHRHFVGTRTQIMYNSSSTLSHLTRPGSSANIIWSSAIHSSTICHDSRRYSRSIIAALSGAHHPSPTLVQIDQHSLARHAPS